MNGNFVFINGEFVPRERAAIHVDDLLVQRGYGIFDFFRTHEGRPVFLDDHLDRFEHSASRMRLPIGKSRAELKAVLAELFDRNGIPDSGVRLTLTGGASGDGYSIGSPNLIITQRPVHANPALAANGVRLASYAHQRQMCDVKSLDYLMAIWLMPFARERGADDVLYHRDGVISECPRSNVFIVTRDGRLLTPGEHVLKGVIRKHVLGLARDRMPTAEPRAITLEQLLGAAEVFITSTTKGVVPVVEVDDRLIGAGRPGETARLLGQALAERSKAASLALR